jgi:hypothetical protein
MPPKRMMQYKEYKNITKKNQEFSPNLRKYTIMENSLSCSCIRLHLQRTYCTQFTLQLHTYKGTVCNIIITQCKDTIP